MIIEFLEATQFAGKIYQAGKKITVDDKAEIPKELYPAILVDGKKPGEKKVAAKKSEA
ncbi:hypothetical protein [Rhodobacteraceae phage LS06-2018-MD07]|jgi:hypothetical protein|nr:hypothetical protein [Rhodobacteraceae phage LS06-2018-MD07]